MVPSGPIAQEHWMSGFVQPGSGRSTPGLVVSNVRRSAGCLVGPVWGLRPVCWASPWYCGRPVVGGAGATVARGFGGASGGLGAGSTVVGRTGAADAVGTAVGAAWVGVTAGVAVGWSGGRAGGGVAMIVSGSCPQAPSAASAVNASPAFSRTRRPRRCEKKACIRISLGSSAVGASLRGGWLVHNRNGVPLIVGRSVSQQRLDLLDQPLDRDEVRLFEPRAERDRRHVWRRHPRDRRVEPGEAFLADVRRDLGAGA